VGARLRRDRARQDGDHRPHRPAHPRGAGAASGAAAADRHAVLGQLGRGQHHRQLLGCRAVVRRGDQQVGCGDHQGDDRSRSAARRRSPPGREHVRRQRSPRVAARQGLIRAARSATRSAGRGTYASQLQPGRAF